MGTASNAIRWEPQRQHSTPEWPLIGRSLAKSRYLCANEQSSVLRPTIFPEYGRLDFKLLQPPPNCFGLEAIHIPDHGAIASDESNCVLIIFILFLSLQAQLSADFKCRVVVLVVSAASDIKNERKWNLESVKGFAN